MAGGIFSSDHRDLVGIQAGLADDFLQSGQGELAYTSQLSACKIGESVFTARKLVRAPRKIAEHPQGS